MRVFIGTFLAVALYAQLRTPAKDPQWLAELRNLQEQAYRAPLGSLDSRMQTAWRAALREPQHPQFASAAEMASGYYRSQGYELEAERILRRALAAVPREASPREHRRLTRALIVHFESTQQQAKALPLREAAAREPSLSADDLPSGQTAGLAQLYERMGEIEKAEAAWKEMKSQRAAEKASSDNRTTTRRVNQIAGLGYSHAVDELADFYSRTGRLAEAEKLYQDALASGTADLSVAYAEFLVRQQRFDPAVDLLRQSVARLERSPDSHSLHQAFYLQQRLADVLMQAGKTADGLDLLRQRVQAVESRGRRQEYLQALGNLGHAQLLHNRLEEAEQTVTRMRAAGASNPAVVHMLAQLRERQQKPEEARALRATLQEAPVRPDESVTFHDLFARAADALRKGEIDAGLAAAGQAVAIGAEQIRTQPQSLGLLGNIVQQLHTGDQQEHARRLALETLRILEQAPDHPRITDPMFSLVSQFAAIGMVAEAERLLERQQGILVAAKGEESIALKTVSYGRIMLMQRNSDWTGILEERKRMLARTANATGPRSRESMYALREVAWAYGPLDNWPEEERVLMSLRTHTANLLGSANPEYFQLLEHIANRAAHHRQTDVALHWINQAIEAARTAPEGDKFLPNLVETRARFLSAQAPDPR